MKEMYSTMLQLAEEGHTGQKRRLNKDKSGKPENYIEHPKRVSNQFKDDVKKTLGIGHDLGEDHPEYWNIIKKLFPKSIYDGLQLLARKEGETYFDFIMRIMNSGNKDAVAVK